jgi:hypothetical protein
MSINPNPSEIKNPLDSLPSSAAIQPPDGVLLSEVNLRELTDKLKVTRGKGYYTILKQILAICGQQMADEARATKEANEALTLYDLGALALKYDLNFKATVEWLEESRVLKSGAYQRLIDRGVKAQELFAKVKERQAVQR